MYRLMPLMGSSDFAFFSVAGFFRRRIPAQTPPSASERAAYTGLHAAAASGNVTEIRKLIGRRPISTRATAPVVRRCMSRRLVRMMTPCVRSSQAAANINAQENDRYDVITIAAVKDDVAMVKLAIELGGNAKAITSRYDGTALIAAAHLGHDGVTKR